MSGGRDDEIQVHPDGLKDYGDEVIDAGKKVGERLFTLLGRSPDSGTVAVTAAQVGARALFDELVAFGAEAVQNARVLALFGNDAAKGVSTLGVTAVEISEMYRAADNQADKDLDVIKDSLVRGSLGSESASTAGPPSYLSRYEPVVDQSRRLRAERRGHEYPYEPPPGPKETVWEGLGVEEILQRISSADPAPVQKLAQQWDQVALDLRQASKDVSSASGKRDKAWPRGQASDEYRKEVDAALDSIDKWQNAIQKRGADFEDAAKAMTTARTDINNFISRLNSRKADLRRSMSEDPTSVGNIPYALDRLEGEMLPEAARIARQLVAELNKVWLWKSVPETYWGMLRDDAVPPPSNHDRNSRTQQPTPPAPTGGGPQVRRPNLDHPGTNDKGGPPQPDIRMQLVPRSNPQTEQSPQQQSPQRQAPAPEEQPPPAPTQVPPPADAEAPPPAPSLPGVTDPNLPGLGAHPEPPSIDRPELSAPPALTPWAPSNWAPGGGTGAGSLGGRTGGGRDLPVASAAPGSGTLLGRGAFEPGGDELDAVPASAGSDEAGGPGTGMPMMPPMMPPAAGGGGGGGGGGRGRPVRPGGPRLVQPEDGDGGKAISGRGTDQRRARPRIVELETEDWTTAPRPQEQPAERPEQRRTYGV